MTGMLAIDAMRARLDGAGSLAETLATGWDAFELLRAATDGCADGADGLFAAFMTASASAANGRDLVGWAPSLPPGRAAGIGPRHEPLHDPDEVADALAMLATALSARLSSAASQAAHTEDRSACEHAADEARRIRALLIRDA